MTELDYSIEDEIMRNCNHQYVIDTILALHPDGEAILVCPYCGDIEDIAKLYPAGTTSITEYTFLDFEQWS